MVLGPLKRMPIPKDYLFAVEVGVITAILVIGVQFLVRGFLLVYEGRYLDIDLSTQFFSFIILWVIFYVVSFLRNKNEK